MPKLKMTVSRRPYVQVFFGLGGEDDEQPGEPIFRSYRLRPEGLKYLAERGCAVGDSFSFTVFYELANRGCVEAGFVNAPDPAGLAAKALTRRLNQWRDEWVARTIPTPQLLESIEDDIRRIQNNAFLLERALLWVTRAVEGARQSGTGDAPEFQRQARLLFQRVREAFPDDTETVPARRYIGPDGLNYSRS